MLRIFLIALSFTAISTTAATADTYVRGHTRSDGTYVQPHHRTNPDGNRFNNYGTQGNVNPYTGQSGTVDPTGRRQIRTVRPTSPTAEAFMAVNDATR